ncbi:MAG: alpha/beta hydrolase fold domain-containing protein [Prevotella sp.]|nr:alpha/beta hydrolase fold domain-containing protein [Prevotella sp.]
MNKLALLWVVPAFFVSMQSVAQTARTFTLTNSEDGESTLTCFLPDQPSGRAVVACPGGGYSHLAMEHEGTDWATFFNAQGIAYFVLKYRMPNGDRNIPLGDAYNAIKTVRDSAASWRVNPYDVGIMGSSAGGHLASVVSTHAPFAVRPNFTILFYPVISMDERSTHRGSVVGFLGEQRTDKNLVKEFSSDHAVRRHLTPPAIILTSGDDRVVYPVTNGVAYFSAMRRAGNPCALHVYPSGGHGWGFRSNFAYHEQMLGELTQWLKTLKSPREDALRVACIGNSITDGSGIDMAEVNGYPAQLQLMLGGGYRVKNFGVGARTMLNKGDHPYMQEMAWRDALAFNPNIVVIKLGTNDSKPENWQYGNEFEHDMQQMIDSLKSLPARPKIYLATPIRAFKVQWGINDSTIVNGVIPVIEKLAKKNKCAVIDLHAKFSDPDGKQMQVDGIHPTDTGAGQMARIICDALKE